MSLLELINISVSYGGNHAISNVSLSVQEGQLAGLIGPNGAGKTTLFNTICGLLAPDSGQVNFAGTDITKIPPHRRSRLGLARTFQRLELFTSLSVLENIRVAGEIAGFSKTAEEESHRILKLVGLEEIADHNVSEIPTGHSRIVEMARALMIRPRLLLLDEPASGQTETETQQFGELLKRLQKEGHTILLVEHDMNLVMSICEEITVLDFGQIIAKGQPNEIRTNPAVLSAYLGNDRNG